MSWSYAKAKTVHHDYSYGMSHVTTLELGVYALWLKNLWVLTKYLETHAYMQQMNKSSS